MIRRLVIILVVLFSGAVDAQENPPLGPIGSVEAGDFRALAVTADGSRLMIADAENNQLRVYNFADPASPVLISSVGLDGEPVAVAAARDFALVAVVTPEDVDAVRVIAPSRYSRPQGYIEANSLEILDNPRAITLSPDNYWALAISDGGYTLLELVSAGEINSLPVEADVIDAAVGGDTAFLLGESALTTQSLRVNLDMQAVESITLDGAARRVLLNPSLSLGAILMADNRVLLFNPGTLDVLSTFTVAGDSIRDAKFISTEDAEWLALTQTGNADIPLFDVTDPANVGDLGTLETQFETPVQALTTYNEFIVATDGQTVRIFQR
ncbi:MAG: hypothetical protein IAE80_12875 [Anaerolinea sp.]|nr:hypothetical protein [Anaerolinea sp.]